MPTIRQKKAFKKSLENGGVISQAMIESDYSEAMAKNPQKLTESKGWKELMDTYMPDATLALKHSQLLNDEQAGIQVKALDMAYKLKGSYAPDKAINLNLEVPMDDPMIQKLAEALNKQMKDELTQ